jgi:Protein of unknown function (DUF429)
MTFRRQLLAEAGICLPDDLGSAGEKAAPDDVLDAAAAAWTALRVLRNQRPSPNPPELFSGGLPIGRPSPLDHSCELGYLPANGQSLAPPLTAGRG